MNLWLDKKAQPKNLSLDSGEKYTSRWFQQIPCSNIKLTNSSWSASKQLLDVINVGIHRYIHKSATFRFRNNKTPPIHKPINFKFYHAFPFFFVYVFQNISRTDLWHLQVNGVRGTIFDVRQTVRHFIGGISVRSHRWTVWDRWTARSF